VVFIKASLYSNSIIFRFSFQYFTKDKRAPFQAADNDGQTPKKRTKKSKQTTSDLEIVEACHRFLKLDFDFYRRIWNWDEFIELYHNCGCDLQKFYCNQIIGLLFGMNSSQVVKLNDKVPKDIYVRSELSEVTEAEIAIASVEECEPLEWKFVSDVITDIEGVYLPIYDQFNHQFYNEHQSTEKIIHVDSTKINLRSLALGISSGKAICLTGPVGCGKTTLVEYLARKTGRLAPKINEFAQFIEQKQQKVEMKGSKRKLITKDTEFKIPDDFKRVAPKSGFLRIQLGDQTDSKVLLGQYRCTDVPGEFLWQPGVLTQAVMNGFWLLLEDLDTATKDVCTVLTNMLENNSLSVPGFRDNMKIAPGFQLFVTLR